MKDVITLKCVSSVAQVVVSFVLDSKTAELPCKIGDKLYFVPDAGYILTCTVAAIHISDEKSVRKKLHKSHIIAISHLSGFGIKFNFDNFGKIVFRTREEAEAVLEERENNDA